MMLPKPWQVGQAPNGLLNENSRGCGISYGMPHVRHSKRSLKRCDGRGAPASVELDGERRAAAFAVRRLDRVGEPRAQVAVDLAGDRR